MRYRVSDEVLLRAEEDGGIALDSRTGRMLGLNTTAFHLLHWLIQESSSLKDLIHKLENQYQCAGSRKDIQKNIEDFLISLDRLQFLEPSSGR